MNVLLTGGSGMLGKSIFRLAVKKQSPIHFISPTRYQLDLLDRGAVRNFLFHHKCDAIIHCAAKVGGIKANIDDPIGFMTQNILISMNLIEEARLQRIPKIINVGSSCMYPRDFKGDLTEEFLLAAPLEPTNEGYAIAKISAARLCQYVSEQDKLIYRTFIPCNLYGPEDNFDLETSHMIPAAIAKIDAAHKSGDLDVEIWGDGTPRREFLYVDDLAGFILDSLSSLDRYPQNLNVGMGFDLAVSEYYEAIADMIGFKGKFVYNLKAPVGMSHKLMNIDKAKAYGWHPATSLKRGLEETYSSYQKAISAF